MTNRRMLSSSILDEKIRKYNALRAEKSAREEERAGREYQQLLDREEDVNWARDAAVEEKKEHLGRKNALESKLGMPLSQGLADPVPGQFAQDVYEGQVEVARGLVSPAVKTHQLIDKYERNGGGWLSKEWVNMMNNMPFLNLDKFNKQTQADVGLSWQEIRDIVHAVNRNPKEKKPKLSPFLQSLADEGWAVQDFLLRNPKEIKGEHLVRELPAGLPPAAQGKPSMEEFVKSMFTPYWQPPKTQEEKEKEHQDLLGDIGRTLAASPEKGAEITLPARQKAFGLGQELGLLGADEQFTPEWGLSMSAAQKMSTQTQAPAENARVQYASSVRTESVPQVTESQEGIESPSAEPVERAEGTEVESEPVEDINVSEGAEVPGQQAQALPETQETDLQEKQGNVEPVLMASVPPEKHAIPDKTKASESPKDDSVINPETRMLHKEYKEGLGRKIQDLKKSGKSWGEAFTEISSELQENGLPEKEAQRKAGILMGSYYGQGTVSRDDVNAVGIDNQSGNIKSSDKLPGSGVQEKLTGLKGKYGLWGSSDSWNNMLSYMPYFESASAKYGVPTELLLAMALQESRFRADARSKAGAVGIMQLMPATAREMGLRVNDKVDERIDPQKCIMAGAKYLRKMLDNQGENVANALAGYNAGLGNVKKYGGIPPFKETQRYISIITTNIPRFKLFLGEYKEITSQISLKKVDRDRMGRLIQDDKAAKKSRMEVEETAYQELLKLGFSEADARQKSGILIREFYDDKQTQHTSQLKGADKQ